jgi:type I restriction enzyme M protein
VIAGWWGEIQYDIRTLAYRQYSGVVQGWRTTIEAAFENDGEDETRDKQRIAAEKRKAREHSAVPLLIPDYLTALEAAEAHRADLDAQLKAATAKPDDEDADTDDVPAETLSPAELKKLRAELANARAQVRRLENDFLKQLRNAVSLLTADQEEILVRRIMKADLKRRLDAGFAAAPRALADRYRLWATKYAITLGAVEAARERAVARVDAYLKDLGYE